MDTKLTGDIAEQAVILQALKNSWGVLRPIGDRLPYDLVFDVNGTLVKIQVKSAWWHERTGNYVVDNRRTKKIGALCSDRLIITWILILLSFIYLKSRHFMSCQWMYLSATEVKFTLSKLTSVSEDHGPPNIVTLGY